MKPGRKPASLPWWTRVNSGNKEKGLREGFRSGLEENNARALERMGVPVLFEVFRVPYVVPAKLHHYSPDFVLPNGIIVETKGVFDATDRAKHLLIKMQYPELDIRLVFTRLKTPIAPGSKTTVEEWATKHGYKYAEKLIPPQWLDEPGPKRSPEEVINGGPGEYAKLLKEGAPRK